MAVHKRNYRTYSGLTTKPDFRFLVITRYALEDLLKSRALIVLLAACAAFPLFGLGAIYLRHNLATLAVLGLSVDNLLKIDSEFFAAFLAVQGWFAFLVTAYAGPPLLSPDLTDNALPLFLSRPISRTQYVLGKMAVLFFPLSCITWISGLLLFFVQAGLEGGGWGWNNAHLAWALFLGSWIWIVLLSLLAMALSAWVRWRLAASGLLFAIFFITGSFSEVVNEVLRTKSGYLLSLGYLIGTIWAKLLQVPARRTMIGEIFNVRSGDDIPLWAACLALALVAAACLYLLNKKLRGREVVS